MKSLYVYTHTHTLHPKLLFLEGCFGRWREREGRSKLQSDRQTGRQTDRKANFLCVFVSGQCYSQTGSGLCPGLLFCHLSFCCHVSLRHTVETSPSSCRHTHTHTYTHTLTHTRLLCLSERDTFCSGMLSTPPPLHSTICV